MENVLKQEWQKTSHGWQEWDGSRRDWKGKADTCKLDLFLLSRLFATHGVLIQYNREKKFLHLQSFVMLRSNFILCQLKSVCQPLWRVEGWRYPRSGGQGVLRENIWCHTAGECFYSQPRGRRWVYGKAFHLHFLVSVLGYWILHPHCASLTKLFSFVAS